MTSPHCRAVQWSHVFICKYTCVHTGQVHLDLSSRPRVVCCSGTHACNRQQLMCCQRLHQQWQKWLRQGFERHDNAGPAMGLACSSKALLRNHAGTLIRTQPGVSLLQLWSLMGHGSDSRHSLRSSALYGSQPVQGVCHTPIQSVL